MGVKKMLWLLHTSFKAQTTKINSRKKIVKCGVILFIKHFCILNNNTSTSMSKKRRKENKNKKLGKKLFDNFRLDRFKIEVNYKNDN